MKKKIFPIVCIFLILIFSVFNYSFGYSFNSKDNREFTFNDNVVNTIKTWDIYNSPDFYTLGCQWSYSSRNNYFVFFIKKTDTLRITFENGKNWSSNEVVEYTSVSFDRDGNTSDAQPDINNLNLTSAQISNKYFFGNDTYENVAFLSGGTFYKSDGTVFFLTPPVTLEGILKQEKTEAKTMQEILGVLPLTIVVVASFLGLRKALRMLLNFLNNS